MQELFEQVHHERLVAVMRLLLVTEANLRLNGKAKEMKWWQKPVLRVRLLPAEWGIRVPRQWHVNIRLR